MSWINDALAKILGTETIRGGRNMPTEQYSSGNQMIKPIPDDYAYPTATAQPTMEYGAVPSMREPEYSNLPQSAFEGPKITGEVGTAEANPYEFPGGDKPPIPSQYHQTLNQVENPNVVASVLAQETGGFNYRPAILEPYEASDETDKPVTKYKIGEILNNWDEARERKVKGPSGEVGIAQIIPKWHWQKAREAYGDDAPFNSEEEYADLLYDPAFSIQEAGRILNTQLRLNGDWVKTLNTWNKNPNYAKEVLGRIGVQL